MELGGEGEAPAQDPPDFKAPAPRFKPVAPPPRFNADARAAPADNGAPMTATGSQGGSSIGNDSSSGKPSAPSPTKFAPPPPRPAEAAAAKAAAVAAARAAQHATPAQRERMAMEAAANTLAAEQAQQEREAEAIAMQAAAAEAGGGRRGAPDAARPPVRYQPPSWSGVPVGVPYTLEVMKAGAMLDTLEVAGRDHCTLGRAPTNDIVLDHPSSSRMHAVLQFRGQDGAAFVYDPASTHGTFLNKKRIPTGVHVQLRVGDQLRFGESSRIYILCGPMKLMPEEGPSREDCMKQAALKALAARREREEHISKVQMEVALGGGASWGFGEDGYDEDAELENVDWRAYAATKGLSEKQQKVADKIRKREARIQQLQREIEKIKVKEQQMEELSAGQAAVLVRNEQEIDWSMGELEELEEQLVDSLRDAIGQRRVAAEKTGSVKKKKKKRRRDSDDKYACSSDDDAFYDRTAKGAGRHNDGGGKKQEVEDAASLWSKKEALQGERQCLQQQLEKEEVGAAAKAAAGGNSAGTVPAAAAAAAQADSLDVFMTDVAVQLEGAKAVAVRKELADVDAQLARVERLLKIADPDGYFKAGSKAVAAAAERAKRQMSLEKQRREAEERQHKQQEAKRARERETFVPEVEEDEQDEQMRSAAEASKAAKAAIAAKAAASVHTLQAEDEQTGGLQIRKCPQAASAPAALAPAAHAGGQRPSAVAALGESNFERRRKMIAASLAQQKEKEKGDAAASGSGSGGNQDAVEQVMADLALLSRARQGAVAEEDDEARQEKEQLEWEVQRKKRKQQQQKQDGGRDMAEGWQPPQDQTGDGRIALNDRLGY